MDGRGGVEGWDDGWGEAMEVVRSRHIISREEDRVKSLTGMTSISDLMTR